MPVFTKWLATELQSLEIKRSALILIYGKPILLGWA
jgi:hypothetical protein